MATRDFIEPEEFRQLCRHEQASSIKMFHLNVQSAVNKGTQLEVLFNQLENAFDIIMFTETWYAEKKQYFQYPWVSKLSAK